MGCSTTTLWLHHSSSKGVEHVALDFLSRSVPMPEVDTSLAAIDCANPTLKDRWYQMLRNVVEFPDKYPPWRIENGILLKYWPPKAPAFATEKDFWEIVLPKDKGREYLKSHHDVPTCGHLGVYKTYWRPRNRFYWPCMRADVVTYVRNCGVCTQHKPLQHAPAGLMVKRSVTRAPWEQVSLDFIGPFPRSSKW